MAIEYNDLFNNDDRVSADLDAVRLLHMGCWRDFCLGAREEPDPSPAELASACRDLALNPAERSAQVIA